jgi:hypothetical protein
MTKEWSSKQELKTEQETLEGKTAEALKEAEQNQKEVGETSAAMEAQESPVLKETADALNRIADEFAAEAGREIGRHESEVEDSVGGERADVSEPAREGGEKEKEQASAIESRGAGAGRYLENLTRAARERSEAADFLSGVADGSERHQGESKGESERLAEEARRAAEAIKRL